MALTADAKTPSQTRARHHRHHQTHHSGRSHFPQVPLSPMRTVGHASTRARTYIARIHARGQSVERRADARSRGSSNSARTGAYHRGGAMPLTFRRTTREWCGRSHHSRESQVLVHRRAAPPAITLTSLVLAPACIPSASCVRARARAFTHIRTCHATRVIGSPVPLCRRDAS